MISLILCGSIIVAGILVDQLTKWLAVEYLMKIGTFPIIKDVLHLTYVENTGAAFGMLKNNRWVFMVLSTVAIVAMIAYLLFKRPTDKLEGISLALIVSGGIGNMIDRIFLGYVVDFVDFRIINFAVFNVADICVCVGAGLLMLWAVLGIVKESQEKKALEAQAASDSDDKNGDD